MRLNSLSNISLGQWRWNEVFIDLIDHLSDFDLEAIPIEKKFLYKRQITGSPRKPIEVTTSTWACKANKIRQIRAACIQASSSLAVLNLVITPLNQFDLPFFGADFVSLPNGHLLALDLQPALKNDLLHTQDVWEELIPMHNYWQSLLPPGGPIPKDAEPFFSPGFLWTRLPLDIDSEEIIANIIRPAFSEYLSFYLKLLNKANIVSKVREVEILEGQRAYFSYRSANDPARGMLSRFYGEKWTEEYINNVLFKI